MRRVLQATLIILALLLSATGAMGEVGKALSFQAATQQAWFTTASWPTGSTVRTMTAWVAFTNGQDAVYKPVVAYGNRDSFGYEFGSHFFNGAMSAQDYGAGFDCTNTITYPMTWTFFAVAVSNGTTVGISKNGGSYQWGNGTLASSGRPINTHLGTGVVARWSVANFASYGTIDEIVMFSRIVTEAELATMYNSGSPAFSDTNNAPFNSGLVSLFRFDEGSGTSFADAGPSSNTGTLNGVGWVDGIVPLQSAPARRSIGPIYNAWLMGGQR